MEHAKSALKKWPHIYLKIELKKWPQLLDNRVEKVTSTKVWSHFSSKKWRQLFISDFFPQIDN